MARLPSGKLQDLLTTAVVAAVLDEYPGLDRHTAELKTKLQKRVGQAIREAYRAFGRQGGLTRATQQSAEERSALAAKAASARWHPNKA